MKAILSSAEPSLVSGDPYWPRHSAEPRSFPTLDENLSADLVVIGGGITGSLLSYHATLAGLETVLIDRGRFGFGSTQASTALIGYEFDLMLTELSEMIGERKAARIYELCFQATKQFKALVRKIENPCDYDDKSCLRITENPADRKAFDKESRARQKLGFDIESLAPEDLEKRFGLAAAGGLVSGNAAQIDPFQLTRRLIAHSYRKGLRAFEGVKATKIESERRGVSIHTAGGPVIQAKKVLFATGYESEKYLGKSLGSKSTDFCFISHPLRTLGKLEKCHVVQHADDYFYLSTFGNRVMVGVESSRLHTPKSRRTSIPSITKKLLEKVGPFVPELQPSIHYRWAGTFANSPDSLPFLVTSDRIPHSAFVMGYGGNGIAASAMLAPLAIDLIQGKSNRDVGLFSPDR